VMTPDDDWCCCGWCPTNCWTALATSPPQVSSALSTAFFGWNGKTRVNMSREPWCWTARSLTVPDEGSMFAGSSLLLSAKFNTFSTVRCWCSWPMHLNSSSSEPFGMLTFQG
jgi:hypothetical protein